MSVKMHVFYLALCVLSISSCFAKPLFATEAVPRSLIATSPSLNDLPDVEPTCTEPGALSDSLNDLGVFSSDCIAAADDFFDRIVAQISFRWKRVPPGQFPGPGISVLPIDSAYRSCMIKLDVLDDPEAEDTFALVQLAGDLGRLFMKCVTPNPRALAAGFVPVGPRKVLKLSISPRPPGPMAGNLEKGGLVLNGTRLSNVTAPE